MCNLYSETKGQEAIRAAAPVMRDVTGNLPTFAERMLPDSVAAAHSTPGVNDPVAVPGR